MKALGKILRFSEHNISLVAFISFFLFSATYANEYNQKDELIIEKKDFPADADIFPLKDLETVGRPKSALWLYIILSAITAIGLLVFVKKKQVGGKGNKIVAPPDKQALNELKKLEEKTYSTSVEIKAGYFMLSKILRVYISQTFALPAFQLTSQEIGLFLKRADNQGWSRALNFLKVLDIAKFSDTGPERQAYWAAIREITMFVINTRNRSGTDNG